MNIVLISIDTLRFDCVGYQPDKRELRKFNVEGLLNTPTLDSIAEKSLCFTKCFSTNTYTTSAHASIFTGLYPPGHGVRAFFRSKLSPDAVTLAEVFKEQGYETIMATDKLELFSPIGLDRGFNRIFAENDLELFDFLGRNGDRKFFLFAHFFDVHAPYLYSPDPPEKDGNKDYYEELDRLYKRFGEQRIEKDDLKAWIRLFESGGEKVDILFPVYARGVSKFDNGRFKSFMEKLNTISPFENNMLVIFADHGDGTTGRNSDQFGHAGDLFDSVVRVPLLIRHPDLRPGIAGHITSLVDLFPTILGMNGIETGRTTDGLFMGEGREHIYAETWLSSNASLFMGGLLGQSGKKIRHIEWLLRQRCIRTPKMKFVVTGESEPWLDQYLENSGGVFRGFSNFIHSLLWMLRIYDFPINHLPEGAEATFNLPNAEFVRQLYRKILSRFEDMRGLNNYLSGLESGTMTKGALLMTLLESKEYWDNPKYFVCDCEKDPFEEIPLNPLSNRSLKAEAQRHFETIFRIEASAVQTDAIWNDETELNQRTEAHAESMLSLSEKEEKSIDVIKRAVSLYGVENVGVAWTGGKDSTTVLSLIRQAFDGRVPFKVINIDTSVKFPEIYEFRERLKEGWSLDLRTFKNEEALKTIAIAANHVDCCYQLKTLPLNNAIEALGLEALLTGVRWDEQEARSEEEYFSVRDEPPHVRVQPILHFTEKDIWQYIKGRNVPYCILYERDYRSLGCAPCTMPSDGTGSERQGRAMDKEQVMQSLRDLGYF